MHARAHTHHEAWPISVGIGGLAVDEDRARRPLVVVGGHADGEVGGGVDFKDQAQCRSGGFDAQPRNLHAVGFTPRRREQPFTQLLQDLLVGQRLRLRRR